MTIHIYLDFNVVLDIANGDKRIEPGAEQVFVYSDEHFVETSRGTDLRPIEVLKALDAQKIELNHDATFQLTGAWRFIDADPFEMHAAWREQNVGFEHDGLFLPILSRLLGGEQAADLQQVPAEIQEQLTSLLESNGLLDEPRSKEIEALRRNMEKFVENDLSQVPPLSRQRAAVGLGRGLVGNFAEKRNPLEETWKVIAPTAPGITADQFFGFAPHAFQPQVDTPQFLGIVGCYTVLNWLGLKPDRGLAKRAALPGIQSDAAHVAHAAYCSVLLSSDARLCAKANAIYRYKNIQTQVLLLKGVPQHS